MEMRKFESFPADDPSKNGEDSSTSKVSQTASEIEALRVHQIKDNLNIDPTALSLRHCQPQLLSLTPDADRTPSKKCSVETEGCVYADGTQSKECCVETKGMLHNTREHVETYSMVGDDRTPSKKCSVETEGCVNADRAQPKECCVETKGMLHCTREHVETYSMVGDNGFALSENQHKLGRQNDRKAFLSSGRSALASEKQLAQINPSFAGDENVNFQKNPSLVGCEQIESHSPQRSLTSSQQQSKASCKINHHLVASGQEQELDTHNTSSVRIGRNQFLASGQQQFQETRNVSGIRMFGNQSTYPEPCGLPPPLPLMKSCTTGHSIVPHGGHSRFANPGLVINGGHPRLINPGFVLHGGHFRFAESSGNASIQLPTPSPFENASIQLQSPSPFGSGLPLLGNVIQLRSPSLFGSGLFGNASALSPFGNASIQLQNLSPFGSVPPPFGNTSIQLPSLLPSGSGPQQINIESFKGKGYVKDTLGKDAQEVMTLDYSIDRKEKMVQNEPDQKNESSAETDTMNPDDFKENPQPPNPQPLSVNSSLSEKASFIKPGSTSPVINLEFPTLPPSENVDANSSRTQSLDMETLLIHPEQPSHLNSDSLLVQSAIREPSSRWIKRLKLSASEPSTSGTKSSNGEEDSCHKKKSLGKSPFHNSERTISKLHDKELITFDNTLPSSKCGESDTKEKGKCLLTAQSCVDSLSMDRAEKSKCLLTSQLCGESLFMDTAEKSKCLLTSQSWIRRWWCRNQPEVPQKQPGQVVVCEPNLSKLGSEDKKLPSIAALALMGKTMNDTESCEFERRGAVVVWHTKKF